MAQITMKSVCAIFSLKNQKGYNMYTFDSRIRYSEIDRSGRLSIPAVVDYFQDCSAFQSEELGVGVEYLANKMNISKDEIIAIGDNINDKEMIENAKVGIAMGQSTPVITEIADFVTSNNNEDGVAKALEKYC